MIDYNFRSCDLMSGYILMPVTLRVMTTFRAGELMKDFHVRSDNLIIDILKPADLMSVDIPCHGHL